MTEAPAACEIWFYHLERSSLEQVLPDLLEKTLARGWRAQVRARDEARLDDLDERLWTWKDDAFLAHGKAGELHEARQPIVLTTGQANENAAQALFLVDGAEPGDVTGYVRCITLFDGRDEAATAEARVRWKGFAAQGLPVSYWRQTEDGRWEKKA